MTAAGDARHAACAGREAALRDRRTARQAHQQAGAMMERPRRWVGGLTDQLGRMALCPTMRRYRFVSVF